MTKGLWEGIELSLDMSNLQDYSGNGNDGTATGTTLTTDQYNRNNRAREFNGINDVITISDSTTLRFDDSFTVSLWIYPTVTNTQYIILQKRDAGGTNYQYYTSTTGTLRFYDGSTELDFGYDIDTHVNSWVHLAFVTDASDNVELFVNGASQGSVSASISSDDADISIGEQYTGTIPFTGKISNIYIYNRELSENEIYQLYTETQGNYQGLFDGCVAYYDFKNDAKDIFATYDATGTNTSSTTDQHGKTDSAFLFNGTSAYMTIPIDMNDFSSANTLNIWLTTDDISDDSYIFSHDAARYSMGKNISGVSGSGWQATIYDGSNSHTVSTTGYATGWHMFTMVYTGSTLYFYIDGTEIGNQASASLNISSNNQVLCKRSDAGTQYADTEVSSFTMWDRALSGDEVQALYDLTSKRDIYPYMKAVDQ